MREQEIQNILDTNIISNIDKSSESQADSPKDKAKIKEALIFYELKVNALRI